MILKLSICTLASSWWQRSDWGLRMTQNAYFSHAKKLLLVTYCDTTAETEVSVWTHGRTERNERKDGQTDVNVEIVI